jgi:hypothetical protein
MKIPTLPFTVTDWSGVLATRHPGETGSAMAHDRDWRSSRAHGGVHARLSRDHWCDRGDVLYVIEGELDTELKTDVASS